MYIMYYLKSFIKIGDKNEKIFTKWVANSIDRCNFSEDWDMVVAMSSSSGMLNTNSDGSFHKPKNVQSAEDWASQNAGGGVINVHGSEAYQLNNTTVYVRYYAEGVVADGDGGMKPYRTRVTGVWVKEGMNWVVKTSHFSSAAYGGTHQTVQADFED